MANVPDTPGNERLPVAASGRSHPAQQSKMRTLRFNWARPVGYDFLIAFKLGTFDEGGAQSYASDLARRLHERDFKVFFSEEEASLGEELDGTISRWLRRSRVLIVIANDGALTRSKWVRKEVEIFCAHRPRNAVAVINVDGQTFAMINPRIVEADGTDSQEEGCLSIPDLFAEVTRPDRIVLEALDEDGQPMRLELSALPARAVQHELDHLDGIMFIDHLSVLKRQMLVSRWKKDHRNEPLTRTPVPEDPNADG